MSFWKKLVLGRHARVCYSQCGEDLIADSVFLNLGIRTLLPGHRRARPGLPEQHVLFLPEGGAASAWSRIRSSTRIRKKRPRDICLNAGIGAEGTEKAPSTA